MSGKAVVLAHGCDTGAAAVAAHLSGALGPHAVIALRPERLALARWSHRVSSGGRAATDLRWTNGLEIRSSDIACLLNRLVYLPTPRFNKAKAKDRDYANSEMQALASSWLAGLGEAVVNPANSRAQSCGPASPKAWLAMAAACGLPVAMFRSATAGRMIGSHPGTIVSMKHPWPSGVNGPMPAESEPDPEELVNTGNVLIVGHCACGPMAHKFGEQCLEVALRAGCNLLEFRFCRLAEGTVLVAIDPFPTLSEAWASEAVAGFLLSKTGGGKEP